MTSLFRAVVASPRVWNSAQTRSFSSRRVDRRVLSAAIRRADLSEEALEREVKKGLDKEGDYTKGDLPEQPEFLTHWNVDWSEPQIVSNLHIFYAWVLFFGGLLTLREIIKAYREFYPLATIREELGNERGQYGVEYIAELEAKGVSGLPKVEVAAAPAAAEEKH